MTTLPKKSKQSSRAAKINRMVADGTKNYPSYLKLIYTGDSELSSEEETTPSRRLHCRPSLPLLSSACSSLQTASHNVSAGQKIEHSSGVCKEQCSKILDASGTPTSKKVSSSSATGTLVSPESCKLKDEGKEKAATPLANACTPTPRDNDLFYHDSFPLAGSWHSSVNDKVVLNEDTHLEKMELQRELLLIQDEIASLKDVLDTKVALAAKLKKRLGVGAMTEFKQGLASIKESDTFQRTNAALRSLGGLASRTLTSLKSSRSFFKTPLLRDISNIKQSMSMADITPAKASLKCSRSVNNVCLP